MIGLVITTYNRPEYLQTTLESLAKADLSKVSKLIIIDDNSSDKKTIDLIKKFKIEGLEIEKIFKETNTGMYNSLKTSFDKLLFEYNYDYLCNLDSDVEIHPNLFNELYEVSILNQNKAVVSGFHTDKHRTLTSFPRYVIKRTIGGVNMFFHWSLYVDYVRQGIKAELNWDWEVCKMFNLESKNMVVLNPSLIEHIGEESSVGHIGSDKAVNYGK